MENAEGERRGYGMTGEHSQDAHSEADRQLLARVRAMMAAGDYEGAAAAAGDLLRSPVLRPIAQRLVTACRYATELRFQRPAEATQIVTGLLSDIGSPEHLVPETGEGPQVVESPGSDRVVFVFAGADQAPFAHVVVQSWLRRRRCHAVYVRDPRSQFSITGLPGLAPDLDGCIAGLRRLADGLGATRRYCLGYSANGYSALRYGVGMACEAVLAFSPVTTLDLKPDVRNRFPMIRRLHQENPQLVDDVLPYYRRAENPPRLTIVYGAENRSDRWAAQRMAVLPGVRLVPVPGLADHDSMGVCMVSRRFGPLLDEMFGPA